MRRGTSIFCSTSGTASFVRSVTSTRASVPNGLNSTSQSSTGRPVVPASKFPVVPAAKYQSADAIDAHGPTANWLEDSTPFSTTTSRENASTTTPPAGPSGARPRRVSACGPTATVCATGADPSSG